VLPHDAVVAGTTSRAERQQSEHDRWIVATQDCDLDFTESTSNEPTIELRPVFHVAPPSELGIRSARFLLPDGEYIVASSPRTHVSAAVLAGGLQLPGITPAGLPDSWAVAFKTWLGLRYDRPAVPPELVDLAHRIANEVKRKRRRPTGSLVRDVLMQFSTALVPPRFSLYAVIEHIQDEQVVREWLADIAQAIPHELGLGDVIEVATADQVSLTLVETSYAANVTQLTWGTSGATGEC
jgi:hypothetical protein